MQGPAHPAPRRLMHALKIERSRGAPSMMPLVLAEELGDSVRKRPLRISAKCEEMQEQLCRCDSALTMDGGGDGGVRDGGGEGGDGAEATMAAVMAAARATVVRMAAWAAMMAAAMPVAMELSETASARQAEAMAEATVAPSRAEA